MANWIADKLLNRDTRQGTSLGALRQARRFDVNNYERVINDITGRVTSQQSQRLAVAQGLGLNTSGLIVGGQRDTGKQRVPTSSTRFTQRREKGSVVQRPPSDYVNPNTGTVILPGKNKKSKRTSVGGIRYGQQDPD